MNKEEKQYQNPTSFTNKHKNMLNYLHVVAIRKYQGIEGEKGKEEKGSEKHRKEKE